MPRSTISRYNLVCQDRCATCNADEADFGTALYFAIMGELRATGCIAAIVCLLTSPAACQMMFRGRVVMADASAPPQRVTIEQVCPPDSPVRQAVTNKQGEFL